MHTAVSRGDHTHLTPRSALVFALLADLRERDIAVAVLNGVDGRSGFVGRDVDLLVRRNDVAAVVDLSREVAAAQGWNHTTGRWLGMWWPRGLYQQVFHRLDGEGVLNVAFDLICSNSIAAGFVTAYSPDLLSGTTETVEGVPTSIVAAHMKLCFVKALAGIDAGFVRLDHVAELPAEVRQHITSTLGPRFLRFYEKCVHDGSVRSNWRSLRRRAQRAFLRGHPLAAVRNLMISFVRRLVGSRLEHVQSVAIVGPDGVGKTSAIECARHVLRGAFLDIRYRHWRPQVLPNLADIVGSGRSSPAANRSVPPRRHAGGWATVRLVYYGLDYLVGYWLRDRCSISPEVPVNLYDRCALDMFVDPLRFGLAQKERRLWPIRLMSKMDYVIVLHDDPEDIVGRKPELSNEEVLRQANCWKVFHSQGFVNQIIVVDEKSAEAVGREIGLAILDAVSTRTKPDSPIRANRTT